MTHREKPPDVRLNAHLHQTPVAIIGQAAIFPKAPHVRAYWDNIVQKIDCIVDVPPSRWNVADYYDPDPQALDKTYCKRGGFIPEIEFDPLAFGLPPNILEVTDVSQLLALVVARDLMESSGYGTDATFDRSRVGVILGVVGSLKLTIPLISRLQYPVWRKVLTSSGVSEEDTEKIIKKMKLAYVSWNENAFPGLLGNVVAGRIANRLDLGGTNCVVDAACASSLAAVKMAISELVERRCDMVITGGVDTDNSIFVYMCFSKTPALSKKQSIRPFDDEADGTLMGEGIGMVLLKRLEDAERDHDRIYAVIKGLGASSDGRYSSIYAPRAEGQVKALRRAYQDADVPPASVGLIEAHGTGTSAGDPVEIVALKSVFEKINGQGQHIALGSVKSQIGHTKAAAGVAGLIKVALALHHKVLPPTINVTSPNPKFELENTPLYLNTEIRPWVRAQGAPPRRAGVSAFGFGGSNFHLVLEEYQNEHTEAYRMQHVAHPVLFCAPSPERLLAQCEHALSDLQSEHPEETYAKLRLTSKSLDILPETARLGFVAWNLEDTVEQLQKAVGWLTQKPASESWTHPSGIHYRRASLFDAPKVVALFPGQGSQYLHMGAELGVNFPPLRWAYSLMDRLFMDDDKPSLSQVVFPPPAFDKQQRAEQQRALQNTEYAQAAIGVFSMGLYKILQHAGYTPDFVAGHSFGELTALWASGALPDQDFFALVRARGRAMAPPTVPTFDPGTMLAVRGTFEALQQELAAFPDITMANVNSNTQIVLAGATPAIAQGAEALQAKGYSVTPLSVSAAFHTPLVEHASEPFRQAIEAATFHSPQIPVYANTTGQPYPADPDAIKQLLSQHMLSPVHFKQQIENIYDAGGRLFVEIGPRRILTSLVDDILAERPHLTVPLNPSRRKSSDFQLREAVVKLQVAGLSLQDIDPYQLYV